MGTTVKAAGSAGGVATGSGPGPWKWTDRRINARLGELLAGMDDLRGEIESFVGGVVPGDFLAEFSRDGVDLLSWLQTAANVMEAVQLNVGPLRVESAADRTAGRDSYGYRVG